MCVFVYIYIYIMYVCRYVCTYIYIYVLCIYINMCVRIYIYIYIMYIYMCVCVRIYIYIYIMYIYVCVRIYIYILCIYVYIMNIYIYILCIIYIYILCVYIYMCTYIYIYVYMCVYVYIYMCVRIYIYISRVVKPLNSSYTFRSNRGVRPGLDWSLVTSRVCEHGPFSSLIYHFCYEKKCYPHVKLGHAACNGPAVFSSFQSQIFVSFATLTAFSWSAHLFSRSLWSAFYSVLCL